MLDSIEMQSTADNSLDSPMDSTTPDSPLELNLDSLVFHIFSDNRQVLSISLSSLLLPYVSIPLGISSIKEYEDDVSALFRQLYLLLYYCITHAAYNLTIQLQQYMHQHIVTATRRTRWEGWV